jgi:predicted nucleotidyltransferase
MEGKACRRLKDQRARNHATMEQALHGIAAPLRAMPVVEWLILFGSYARDRANLLAGLDLIVVRRSDKPFLERTAELYRRIAGPVDLDMLVNTPDEIQAMEERGCLRNALREGKVPEKKKSSWALFFWAHPHWGAQRANFGEAAHFSPAPMRGPRPPARRAESPQS